MKQISEKQKQTAADHIYHAQMLQLSRALKAVDEERQKDRRRDLIFNSDSELGHNVVAEKKNVFQVKLLQSSNTYTDTCSTASHVPPSYSAPRTAPQILQRFWPLLNTNTTYTGKREHFKLCFSVLKSGGGKHW